VKLLALSDTHASWETFAAERLPHADIVVIAGDLTDRGYLDDQAERRAAAGWLSDLGARYPVVYWVPGNHDGPDESLETPGRANVHCVRDRTVSLSATDRGRPLLLHGVSLAPVWTKPEFALLFSHMTADDHEEERAFAFEPVDIVLSHSPPLGVLDRWPGDARDPAAHLGSRYLSAYIDKNSPRIVICGHIHAASGHVRKGTTDIYNVAGTARLIELDTS
jgi:Icc-related predicted phosphoesterase